MILESLIWATVVETVFLTMIWGTLGVVIMKMFLPEAPKPILCLEDITHEVVPPGHLLHVSQPHWLTNKDSQLFAAIWITKDPVHESHWMHAQGQTRPSVAYDWGWRYHAAVYAPSQVAQLEHRIKNLEQGLQSLINHTIDCERELDQFHGLGDDAGQGCSINILEAEALLKKV